MIIAILILLLIICILMHRYDCRQRDSVRAVKAAREEISRSGLEGCLDTCDAASFWEMSGV